MSIISEWADRMQEIVTKIGNNQYIKKHCPYKCDYFCNGKVNKTNRKKKRIKRQKAMREFYKW